MHPLFHIGGLELQAWRVVVLAGVVLCWLLFLARARRRGWEAGPVLLMLVLALAVGTVGGHLFNAFIPALFGLGRDGSGGGLTVIGSIVSVLAFGFLYSKYALKAEPLQLLDAIAFTFPLSVLVGRFGCILNGCCYGKSAAGGVSGTVLAALTVPVTAFAPGSMAGQELAGAPRDMLLWNLPLVLMLNALLVLVTAETLYRNRERWRLVPGTVMAAVCAQYSGGRFLMEFLRKDVTVGGTIFNPWQLAVLALFCASALWLGVCLGRRARLHATTREAHP